MQVIHERCAGIDVHKKTVVVCVLVTQADGTVQKQIRTFATMTADLLALDEWLRGQQVEQIAMESTGVYWHPIWNLLEEGRQILLANPQHLKAVPGRKTERAGRRMAGRPASTWPAQSELHPTQAGTRVARTDALSQDLGARASERGESPPRSVLEGANIKLAAVATDVLGKSGRQMVEALVGGAQDARAAGGTGAGTAAGQVARLATGSGGTRAAPSPLSAGAYPGAH